eukprot:gene559-8069_t
MNDEEQIKILTNIKPKYAETFITYKNRWKLNAKCLNLNDNYCLKQLPRVHKLQEAINIVRGIASSYQNQVVDTRLKFDTNSSTMYSENLGSKNYQKVHFVDDKHKKGENVNSNLNSSYIYYIKQMK